MTFRSSSTVRATASTSAVRCPNFTPPCDHLDLFLYPSYPREHLCFLLIPESIFASYRILTTQPRNLAESLTTPPSDRIWPGLCTSKLPRTLLSRTHAIQKAVGSEVESVPCYGGATIKYAFIR